MAFGASVNVNLKRIAEQQDLKEGFALTSVDTQNRHLIDT
jgi:hypothetical protein